jgi:integrase/recombinase XerD
MNYLTLLNNMSGEEYLTYLQENLKNRLLLDENRNLTLENSSELDFLELFFLEKLF